MSIIFEGIDPKTDYGLCILTIKGELITANGKHIQAVQIPKGHGRLIDADALFQDLIEHNIPFNNDINSAINVAPTILEAEE